MLKSSNNKFSPVAVGSTVRVPIPDVDTARRAPQNLLAVVSEFNPCQENLLESAKIIANSKEKETTLREATSNTSIAGAQGYTRCQCKTKCTTKRCRCRTENRLCTLKCHGSRSCQNKNE
ncbi:hypothetical protein RN001_000262 [Aquatica leii]|uniref:Uncharacterized protein n=1 Tax=Aquatica leii TaxID=1421715 RepID=A0AAN7PJV2_9COLE|nr:hypothetical protein RN001_000262 [Aquatica leii]